MPKFSNLEKYDMLLIYIENNKNSRLAGQSYLHRFPERNQPNHKTYSRLNFNLQQYGSFEKPRPKNYQKANKENEEIHVLASIEGDPTTSTRKLERETHVNRKKCLRILKNHNYKPYKYRVAQHLQPEDLEKRLRFAQWYVNHNEAFNKKIIWTDEARITNDGIFNRKNNIYWANENPHISVERKRQGRYGINVWCAIMHNRIIGPVFFHQNLTSDVYVNILRDNLEPFLDNMPLNERYEIYFQQDGAPSHNSYAAREYLNNLFGNHVITSHSEIPWPPRSPDMTPLDFSIWGFVKECIYQQPIHNIEDLQERARGAFRTLSNIHLHNACSNVRKRCELCIEHHGGHFEKYL
jgi:DDE superfamily endonuclease/Helix-turn-helix domain (DUF4817)